jgi:hypothetical protein
MGELENGRTGERGNWRTGEWENGMGTLFHSNALTRVKINHTMSFD